MYDADELLGWICMRAMHSNGKPLTRHTIKAYRCQINECLKILESSEDYDTFCDAFMIFYKKYLRKKHRNNESKIYEKISVAKALYKCIKESAQIRISFADYRDVSSHEIKRDDYTYYNSSEILQAAAEG